ncbi:hypothetical protein CLV88_1033 [Shimia abyssi]|uniref:Uncharacterized protein n=1 Tax=Shimia abyssi TaxID=1662395 RepID=A0A2P8FF67_9RHOB|nr:hypothetical protein CLV88_1033 [Shimia abyssi]
MLRTAKPALESIRLTLTIVRLTVFQIGRITKFYFLAFSKFAAHPLCDTTLNFVEPVLFQQANNQFLGVLAVPFVNQGRTLTVT